MGRLPCRAVCDEMDFCGKTLRAAAGMRLPFPIATQIENMSQIKPFNQK